MTIKELKRIVDKAYKKGKDANIEFYINLNSDESIMCDIDYIGQFSVIPDLILEFKVNDNNIDLIINKLNTYELYYKKKYKELKNKLLKIEEILGDDL